VTTRLFAEKGYASASIAEIAAACGVSKALLYHYYRDKEDLLFDVALCYVERLRALVAEVQHERLPAAAHLRRLISRFMTEYEHSAARHRVLVQDVKYLSREDRTRVVAGSARWSPGSPTRSRTRAGRRRGLAPAAGDGAVRDDQLDLYLAAAGRNAQS
jgi:AcrR family transcriptional regulator